MAGAEWVGRRGEEGHEARVAMGQVVRSLVELYKNQYLTRRAGESLRDWSREQWDRTQKL